MSIIFDEEPYAGGYNKAQVDAYLALIVAEHKKDQEKHETLQQKYIHLIQACGAVNSKADCQETSQPALLKTTKVQCAKRLKVLGNALFYSALAMILIGGLLYGLNGEGARSVLGWSLFAVETSSMESEIPRGSLVITKRIDPMNIREGDDITFFKDKNTTVTHRVVAIVENYDGSGQIGFQTWGIENAKVDDGAVFAENVIGKVVGHIPGAGGFLNWTKQHFILILLPVIGVFSVIFALRTAFAKNENVKDKSRKKPDLPMVGNADERR